MSDYLQIDGEEYVHLSTVRRVRSVTDEERASLAKLGEHVDASRFNTRLDYDDNSKSYAPETIDQLSKQVPLLQVDDNTFVPQANVKQARKLTEKDRAGFERRTGRPMREDFVTRIRTTAGAVLSTADPQTIMRRMSQPYRPLQSEKVIGANAPEQTGNGVDMAGMRDQVMKNTSSVKKRETKQPHPDR